MERTSQHGGDVSKAVARLTNAQTNRTPCSPVRDLIHPGGLATAYAVQAAGISRRTAEGARVVGRKIGLTNPRVQAQLGVDQPDFGTLLDTMACDPRQLVDFTRLLQPKIEAEVAFVLCADLDQPNITETEVFAATRHIAPALEIVDSRIADWDITIEDTIADNGSSGLFVLGPARVDLGGIDLSAIEMTMWSAGQIVSSGTGADCLGNPLTAVAWLANVVRHHGSPLRAGDVILSGALGPMSPVTASSSFTADITALGSVSIAFTDETGL